MPISPTAEGFRAAFRRPLLTFAEITWRWIVGAIAGVLFFFGLFEFLDTLPVTNAELLFLRTRNPFLISQAIAHILRGHLSRGLLSLILTALLLAVIWIVAASLGRIATVDALLEYFRARFAENITHEDESDASNNPAQGRFAALLQLNFLRVAVVLAGLVGLAGAAVVARSASTPQDSQTGMVFLLFVAIAGVVCLIGYELNWLLSLAAVFVVRDADGVIDAISSSVALCRRRPAALFAVTTWTGVAHLIVFTGASMVVSVPLALAGMLPLRLVALGVVLVTLAYLAVADWLYTARLAGSVCIAEIPDALLVPPPPLPSPAIPAATIDRDELILSDVPIPHPAT
ncbi:MAG TPA: hypothetical protein VJP02_10795 [Candidatus Sulfotelmatobacter sp.]|nr:hypothetical protein [Candidatus Sulfotelmatobacter sp.]